MLLRALESQERSHSLLIGPPACAKSLFMLEVEKLLQSKRAYFAEEASTTKRGYKNSLQKIRAKKL